MCLYTKQKIAKTANRRIFVYKYFDVEPYGLRSPYKRFVYEINKLYKANLGVGTTGGGEYMISEGLHAFVKPLSRWKKGYKLSLYNTQCFVCEIPKGAKYYRGDDGDIVSNKLIVLRKYSKKK